jgi:transposase
VVSVRVGKGKIHDFKLWKKTKIRLHPKVKLLADSGYEGLQKLKVCTEKPLKRTKKNPLTREQKRQNRELSGRRIKVEHAIRRLKIFRLLSERYRNRRKRFGLRINLIAAIINFEL